MLMSDEYYLGIGPESKVPDCDKFAKWEEYSSHFVKITDNELDSIMVELNGELASGFYTRQFPKGVEIEGIHFHLTGAYTERDVHYNYAVLSTEPVIAPEGLTRVVKKGNDGFLAPADVDKLEKKIKALNEAVKKTAEDKARKKKAKRKYR